MISQRGPRRPPAVYWYWRQYVLAMSRLLRWLQALDGGCLNQNDQCRSLNFPAVENGHETSYELCMLLCFREADTNAQMAALVHKIQLSFQLLDGPFHHVNRKPMIMITRPIINRPGVCANQKGVCVCTHNYIPGIPAILTIVYITNVFCIQQQYIYIWYCWKAHTARPAK